MKANTPIRAGQFIRIETEEVVLAYEDRDGYADYIFACAWSPDDDFGPQGIAMADAELGEQVDYRPIDSVWFAVPVQTTDVGPRANLHSELISDRIAARLGIRVPVRWSQRFTAAAEYRSSPDAVRHLISFDHVYLPAGSGLSWRRLYVFADPIRTVWLPPVDYYAGAIADQVADDIADRAVTLYLAGHRFWDR